MLVADAVIGVGACWYVEIVSKGVCVLVEGRRRVSRSWWEEAIRLSPTVNANVSNLQFGFIFFDNRHFFFVWVGYICMTSVYSSDFVLVCL